MRKGLQRLLVSSVPPLANDTARSLTVFQGLAQILDFGYGPDMKITFLINLSHIPAVLGIRTGFLHRHLPLK